MVIAYILSGSIAAMTVAVIIYGIHWQFFGDKSQWHEVERYRSVTLLDGTKSSSHALWGRKVDGQWQYRELSDEEHTDKLIREFI